MGASTILVPVSGALSSDAEIECNTWSSCGVSSLLKVPYEAGCLLWPLVGVFRVPSEY